jgi:predicted RND superfamily exporter protein
LMRDSTIFLSTGVVLMAGILFLLFRRASGVLLPVATVLQTLVVTYGVMALIGLPTSMSGQMLPVLVMVVGISSSIHVVAIVYRRLADGLAREDAIASALGHSGLAILMASLTTAAGMISFSIAPMGQIANLGRAAPIGVVLTFVYSVTFLPALLAIVPLRSSRYGGDSLQQRLANVLVRIGDFATARPGNVLLVTALVASVAGLGVARLSFSQDGMRWFPEEDPNRQAQEFLDAHFGGVGGVEVWVDTGRENGLHDPELMARLAEAAAFAADLKEGGNELTVGSVVSVVDLVKETHKALHENRSEFYALPAERELLAQELLLFENSGPEHLEDFVDSQLGMARVSLRTPSVDGRYFIPFLENLDAGFRRILGEGVEVRVTGIGALMGRTFTMLNVTMAQSYAVALLVITPLMVLLIGDLRRGLLSMIPNLLPIWLTLGLMGLLGIPLDNSTLLVGCVLIGLAVDDTIHFMHKFQRYHAACGDARQAVRDTLSTTGAALLFTTLVLCSGFAVMTLGYMKLSHEFGMLATFAAMTAFVADLIVSPALMTLATRPREPVAAAAPAD